MAIQKRPAPLTQRDASPMRKAGKLVAQTLAHVAKFIEPGMSTRELDDIILKFTMEKGARSACLNYLGFPLASCISVNGCYCHGVPNDYRLRDGDILTIDVTSQLGEFFADSAKTFVVGKARPEVEELLKVAETAMWKGIEKIRPGVSTEEIGLAIEEYVSSQKFHVFRQMDGHGIGRAFHLEPFISPCREQTRPYTLRAWECITIEPIVSRQEIDPVSRPIPGAKIVEYHSEEGNLSAQFEHTVLITESGFEVLTLS